MTTTTDRPSRRTPVEIAALISTLRDAFDPTEVWLFGSRARGNFRADSDWDLLAVLRDDAPHALLDPITAWEITRQSTVPVTLLATTSSELEQIWGLPNTVGYDLAREGVRLVD